MLAPFHLGKRDSGLKNIISINKLTNLFIKVIKNFLRLSPAGLCFPSLPTCSASVIIRLFCLSHYPPASVIIRLPQSSIRLDWSIRRNGDGSKEIARSSRAMTLKESSRETRKQTGQRQKRRDSLIKTKTPFCSDIPVKPECD